MSEVRETLKRIIKVRGCGNCPFIGEYDGVYSCNISDRKEIEDYVYQEKDYKPDWCQLSKWDSIEIML